MKDQTFGIEIEMNHISRARAAGVVAEHFGTRAEYVGGTYDTWRVADSQGRYEEVLHGATEARIRSDAKPGQTRSYEERFGAIIADCPPDVVEGILSICEQIAHLPGLRK